MSKKQSEKILIGITLSLLFLAGLIGGIKIGIGLTEQKHLCVPRMSGIFTPLDRSPLIAVVLNSTDKYESQLIEANENALQQVRDIQLNKTRR